MTTVPEDVLPVVQRADDVPGPPQGCWTYEDYAKLPNDGRHYHIIAGVLYVAPAPNIAHQNAVGQFFVRLFQFIQARGLGRVIVAPVDVDLGPGGTVQPDVIVVLNEHLDRITASRIVGAPDLVVEVASPSTATHDRRAKMDAYARAGVPEYWIADPVAETVELFVLGEGEYRSLGVFHGQALLPSTIISDFPVHVAEFFA
jgi:Uma2 family endonuclease